ncbi:MAG: hypothetical protein GY816_11715 [Cytophagales bacterium]|nr:hypothetical protein [Cytophagales bacterium]
MGCRKSSYYEGEGAIKNCSVFLGDDLKKKGQPLKKRDDYYPFGLTFNSFTRSYSEKVRYKFQEQEHDEETGWIAFKWRNHQPEIGRFFNVDPLAEKYYYNSPYAFSENKVVVHRELEGLESQYLFNKEVMKTTDYVGQKIDQAGKSIKSGLKAIGNGIVNFLESTDKMFDTSTDVYNTDLSQTDPQSETDTFDQNPETNTDQAGDMSTDSGNTYVGEGGSTNITQTGTSNGEVNEVNGIAN